MSYMTIASDRLEHDGNHLLHQFDYSDLYESLNWSLPRGAGGGGKGERNVSRWRDHRLRVDHPITTNIYSPGRKAREFLQSYKDGICYPYLAHPRHMGHRVTAVAGDGEEGLPLPIPANLLPIPRMINCFCCDKRARGACIPR